MARNFRKIELGPGQYELVPYEEEPQELPKSLHKKLLIGTIFINDSDNQKRWFDLQQLFLNQTTYNFDHITVVYNKSTSYFDNRTHVVVPEKLPRNSAGHIRGLNILLEKFKELQSHYDYFLFIDSDAFPIRKNWIHILESNMRNHDIAAPIRFENLENRLHASVLFVRKSALGNLSFGSRKIGPDLINSAVESDVTIGSYQDELREKAFVLLRSNKMNVNPMLCGIYYDMFYHHCCGSGRHYNLRGRDYWRHVAPINIDVKKFTDELMSNPKEFVSKIAGWNPDQYPGE